MNSSCQKPQHAQFDQYTRLASLLLHVYTATSVPTPRVTVAFDFSYCNVTIEVFVFFKKIYIKLVFIFHLL